MATSVGVPGEGIALILGEDRILDMSRTVLNVSGDLTAACVVARSEGEWSAADVTADEEAFVEEPLDEAPAVYEPPRL